MTIYMALDASSSMAGANLIIAHDISTKLMQELENTGLVTEAGAFAFCRPIVWNPKWMTASELRTELAAWNSTCGESTDGTSLFDAIILGSKTIRSRSSPVKLFVMVTDGDDTTSTASQADATEALRPSGIIGRLVFVGKGSATLNAIAHDAGAHIRAVAANSGNITTLVNEMVDSTCANFRPTASFTISDSELHLGLEGFTITFNGASSSDPDGSIVEYRWHFTQPDGSTFDRKGNPQTITVDDSQLPRGESWSVRLTVRDNKGAEHDISQTFRVIGSNPVISINGATQIDATKPIVLSASTTTDIDGGPPLVLRWDIVSAPPFASLGTQTGYQSGANGGPPSISIPTTDRDIGPWGFRLTARDNEGAEGSSVVYPVEVRNLPPKITLNPSGDIKIDEGQTISVTNTTPDDPDGGTVTHDWELIQAPVAAGAVPGRGYRTSPTLTVMNAPAGTWIFKLHVIDNDRAANSEVTQEVIVLVDGPAKADIIGPENHSALASLTLDGRGSTDADSPPDTPSDHNRGHVTSEASVRGISPGIDSYQWSLIEVPPDQFPRYVMGPVEYSLGVPNGTDRLTISRGLPSGSWTFQLEVVDAELNRDVTIHTILVLEPNTPPTVISSSTGYTLTDVGGNALGPAAATAAASFDLDNLITSPSTPGCNSLGICNFQWQYLLAPAGCQSLPVPTSGSDAATFQLYATGTLIPTLCHGSYLLGVTVTDDDIPSLSSFAQIPLSIGNCPGEICIDYPTTANYQYVEFAESTDVTVFYHLNSALYANPLFGSGVRLEVALFHEDNLVNPVWTGQVDYDILSASYSGYAAAHWSGYTSTGARARPGKYTIRVRATQPLLPTPFSEAVQQEAIWLEVLGVDITADSDRLLSLNRLATGADSLRVNYSVSGHFTAKPSFDEAWLHIRSVANPGNVIGSVPIPSPKAGTFNWTGELSPGVQVSPGEYTAEVEIRKNGRSHGTSPRHPFTAYRIGVQVDGTLPANKQTPGAVLQVNGTPKNLSVNLKPSSLAGDVMLRTSGNVGSTEIKDGEVVLNTDAAGGVTQPASGYAAPKLFTVKMLMGTVSPTRLDVTYASAGNPPGKDASDFINLNGEPVTARINQVTYSGASFHNVAKDSDGSVYGIPQWTDTGNKFPVSYTRNTTVSVSARFELDNTVTGASITVQGEGPGGFHVEGPATIAGTTVTFPTTAFAQALPNTIKRFDPFEIQWQVSLDGGAHFYAAGSSKNKMFVTLADPSALATPLYETILDIGTRNADGLNTPAAAVSGIWANFTTLNVARVDGTVMGYWTGPNPVRCQSLFIMLSEPGGHGSCIAWSQLFHQVLEAEGITGSQIFMILPYMANSPGADGFLVKNWNFGKHIRTGPNGVNNSTNATDDLATVANGNGKPNQSCVGPGPDGVLNSVRGVDDFVLGTQILTGQNGKCESTKAGDDVQIIPVGQGLPNTVAVTPGANGTLNSTASGDDDVQDGSFIGEEYPYIMFTGISVFGNFGYLIGDVADQMGIAGQRNPNPPPEFSNHWVVKYDSQIYDPSYGAGPYASELLHQNAAIDGIGAVDRAKKNNPAVKLLDYQRDSARE